MPQPQSKRSATPSKSKSATSLKRSSISFRSGAPKRSAFSLKSTASSNKRRSAASLKSVRSKRSANKFFRSIVPKRSAAPVRSAASTAALKKKLGVEQIIVGPYGHSNPFHNRVRSRVQTEEASLKKLNQEEAGS